MNFPWPICEWLKKEGILAVPLPGERWEIELMEDGTVEIEKFISEGELYDVQELEVLFREFSD